MDATVDHRQPQVDHQRLEEARATHELRVERRLWAPPSTSAALLPDGRALVRIGSFRQVVEGRSAALVPRLLERLREGAVGEAVVREIAGGDLVAAREVESVLRVLWERGLVDEEDPTPRTEEPTDGERAAQLRYLSFFTSRPYAAVARLARAVAEVSAPPELESRIRQCLASSGVGVVRAPRTPDDGPLGDTPGDRPRVTLLAFRSPDEPELLDRNDALVSRGEPFLCAALAGTGARVGPLVVPGETACLRCVREAERRLVAPLPGGAPPGALRPVPCEPVSLLDLVSAILATEAWKTLTGLFVPALANRRLLIDPGALRFETEAVFKLPRCPACSRAATHAETESFTTIAEPAATEV